MAPTFTNVAVTHTYIEKNIYTCCSNLYHVEATNTLVAAAYIRGAPKYTFFCTKLYSYPTNHTHVAPNYTYVAQTYTLVAPTFTNVTAAYTNVAITHTHVEQTYKYLASTFNHVAATDTLVAAAFIHGAPTYT